MERSRFDGPKAQRNFLQSLRNSSICYTEIKADIASQLWAINTHRSYDQSQLLSQASQLTTPQMAIPDEMQQPYPASAAQATRPTSFERPRLMTQQTSRFSARSPGKVPERQHTKRFSLWQDPTTLFSSKKPILFEDKPNRQKFYRG